MTLRGWRPYTVQSAATIRDLMVPVQDGVPDRMEWQVLAGPYAVLHLPEDEQRLMNLIWDLEGRGISPHTKGMPGERRDCDPVPYVICTTGVPGLVDVYTLIPMRSDDGSATTETLNPGGLN